MDQPPTLSIVPLADVAADRVERLLDEAFGADRHARTAYRLRAGMTSIAALSLAMVTDSGTLLGSLQSWPIELAGEGETVPLVLLGPVAVMPSLQRGGIGRRLMTAMLAEADRIGAPPQVLIGDPEYYGRFGFSADATGGWDVPGPVERHRLLARAGGRSLPATGLLAPRTRRPLAMEQR